mmetsp:Transcript_9365/g.31714  ORF Transcript_9365/g.31714 Transcript_9365/m.31714 type:complete len:251 (-) Transcript_9365:162-914(-)
MWGRPARGPGGSRDTSHPAHLNEGEEVLPLLPPAQIRGQLRVERLCGAHPPRGCGAVQVGPHLEGAEGEARDAQLGGGLVHGLLKGEAQERAAPARVVVRRLLLEACGLRRCQHAPRDGRAESARGALHVHAEGRALLPGPPQAHEGHGKAARVAYGPQHALRQHGGPVAIAGNGLVRGRAAVRHRLAEGRAPAAVAQLALPGEHGLGGLHLRGERPGAAVLRALARGWREAHADAQPVGHLEGKRRLEA